MKMPKIRTRITKAIILSACAGIIWAVLWAGFCLAMDTDLWQLPRLPGSEVLWDDQPMELNQIQARATHLRTELSPQEVVDFYKQALQAQGWKPEGNLTPEIFTFTKEDKFIYLYIFPAHGKRPRDVYLISSPATLTICDSLKDYFLKEQLMPDTEGKDLVDVPRYPGSRRRLDVFFPQGVGVLIYEAEAAPREIAAFFSQEMKASGWKEEKMAFGPQILQKLSSGLKDARLLLFFRGKDSAFFNIMAMPKRVPGVGYQLKNRSTITISRNMDKAFGSLKGGR